MAEHPQQPNHHTMPAVGKTSDMADTSARRDASGPAGLSSPPSGGRAADRRWRWTSSDIAVGAALGVACGLVFWLFNFAYAWLSPIIGGILPVAAEKLHVDPAVMASPLITTIVDTTTLLVYFNIAKALLHL